MFLSSDRNTSESLCEQEMLLEHEPQFDRNKKNMLSISFRKYRNTKKKINLFTSTIEMQILFACAIVTSTARASSVFLSSYRNTVLNQSAHVFAFGYFLKEYKS